MTQGIERPSGTWGAAIGLLVGGLGGVAVSIATSFDVAVCASTGVALGLAAGALIGGHLPAGHAAA